MILRCSNGCTWDTLTEEGKRKQAKHRCAARLPTGKRCGAVLVRDILYPQVGRVLRRPGQGDRYYYREAIDFVTGGPGKVIYRSTLVKAGAVITSQLAQTTYDDWRQWASSQEVVVVDSVPSTPDVEVATEAVIANDVELAEAGAKEAAR